MLINLSTFYEESPSVIANEMLSSVDTKVSSEELNNQHTNEGSKNIKISELEPIIKKKGQ